MNQTDKLKVSWFVKHAREVDANTKSIQPQADPRVSYSKRWQDSGLSAPFIRGTHLHKDVAMSDNTMLKHRGALEQHGAKVAPYGEDSILEQMFLGPYYDLESKELHLYPTRDEQLSPLNPATDYVDPDYMARLERERKKFGTSKNVLYHEATHAFDPYNNYSDYPHQRSYPDSQGATPGPQYESEVPAMVAETVHAMKENNQKPNDVVRQIRDNRSWERVGIKNLVDNTQFLNSNKGIDISAPYQQMDRHGPQLGTPGQKSRYTTQTMGYYPTTPTPIAADTPYEQIGEIKRWVQNLRDPSSNLGRAYLAYAKKRMSNVPYDKFKQP
jgi:hypothetical protein